MDSVTVWLQGGLGNQLFQMNAAEVSSSAASIPLIVSRSSFLRDRLRTFAAKPVVRREVLASLPQELAIGWPYDRTGNIRARIGRYSLLLRDKANEVTAGSLLLGFFQEETDLARTTDGLVSRLRDVRSRLIEDNVARAVRGRPVIHVRRGDYAVNPAAIQAFGAIHPDYYLTALEAAGVRLADTVFFTDDPAYVIDTFGVDPNQVRGPRAGTDLHELLLMSLGSTLVIPNSTFSWWAAEIAGAAATTFAPERWFADGRNSRTLARSSWNLLPIDSRRG